MVDRAIELYLREAYGGSGARSAPAPSGDADAPSDPFQGFTDETREHHSMDSTWARPQYGAEHGAEHGAGHAGRGAEMGEGRDSRRALERWAMRLGNKHYPFMKLILQEHMVPGEFFFTVDTHDQMEIRPDFPDYEDWMKLRRFNLKLKQQIEQVWEGEGVPTLSSLRGVIEEWHKQAELRRAHDESGKRGLILVVDDEEAEACLIEALLQVQGFEVLRAGDGREALDRLRGLSALPILIVLDYEMPEMDGLTLIRELRRHEHTRELRILLTTASQVVAAEREEADAFLAKPFHSRDFLEMVDSLVEGSAGA
jgi:two-component system chemotaxis response regulator CheY